MAALWSHIRLNRVQGFGSGRTNQGALVAIEVDERHIRTLCTTQGIFSVDGVLLVTHGEYSQSVALYWSPVGNIGTPGHQAIIGL
eukprot:420374-Pyramimonas_sp.AAC.1